MHTDQIQKQWVLCHQLPRRIRLRHPLIRNSPLVSRLLQDRLSRLMGVIKVQVRPSTGSVILFYDSEQIMRSQLIERLSVNLAGVLKRVAEEEAPNLGMLIKHSRSPVTSLSYHLINVSVLSGFMAYALVRRLIFKSPLPQKPLSTTGVLTILGAIPLLKRAWSDFQDRKQIGLFAFLTAACGLAIVTGEVLTALEIIWVLSIGMLLETYVTDRARRVIRELFQVAPEKTVVIRDGVETEVRSDEVQVGDTVVLRAGRKIPIDGTVLEGKALVDEANISGRSQPEVRELKDHVYAGTIVQQGMLNIRAEKVGEETYLSRIVGLIEDSFASRTELEKRADILAVRLTRIGVASTACTFLLTGSVARAFSVMLVMACPCATVLAASTAVSAAIANAAEKQIFIKDGIYLEKLAEIDTICFDKTGTITTGTPRVTEILPLAKSQDSVKLLAVAAGAEARSQHPIAKGLIEEAVVRNVAPAEMEEFVETIGQGIRAIYFSHTVLVGSQSFMKSQGIDVDHLKSEAVKFAKTGQTVIYVAIDGRIQGAITLGNTAREGTKAVLERLRRCGVRNLLLISGDTEPVVKTMAETLGFDSYQALMLPEDKALYIDRLVDQGGQVLMIGDGVNDALALSRATVAVAMGAGGSEVAVETAGIALARDELDGLVFLRLLSHSTLRVIEQNFWMANLTNFAGILLGATGWLPPVMAGALHIGHTLGIMVNSGRLIQWEPEVIKD